MSDTAVKQVIEGLGLYFYKLAEQSNDVFWVRSTSMCSQLYVSPGFTKIWQYPRDALYSNPTLWTNSIHPDDRLEVFRAWKRCIQPSSELAQEKYQYRMLDQFGAEHRIDETIFPVHNKGRFVRSKNCCGIGKHIRFRSA